MAGSAHSLGQSRDLRPIGGSVNTVHPGGNIRQQQPGVLIGSLGLRAVALATGVGWVVMTLYQVSTALYLKRRGKN